MIIMNTMVITDWSQINQVVNSINENMKARCTYVYCDNNATMSIDETIITVYTKNGNSEMIVYRFRIESGNPGSWSLTNAEAEGALNSMGFIVDYVPKLSVSDNVKSVLESLKTLGYTHVERRFCAGYGSVVALKVNPNNPEYYGCDYIADKGMIDNFRYSEWLFLPAGRVTLIDGILSMSDS